MRVLVTGGSGFVGAHTVTALLRAGHRVRVLVRSRERLVRALEGVGADPDAVEVAEGDLTRPSSVEPAFATMEAVVHAASVFSLDPRRADEVGRVNLAGLQQVVDRAVDSGLDPIVHVSSIVALLPTDDDVLGPDSPPGASDPDVAPYSASKSAQERWARRQQAAGAPVVTVLPGSVWGPNDPHDGESTRLARDIAARRLVVSLRGGLAVVDVRDVAAVLAAVVSQGPGRGPRRYTAGGTWQTFVDLHREVGSHLDRRLVTVPSPPGPAMLLARGARWAQRRVRARLPIGTEQVFLAASMVPVDDRATMRDLGVPFRPVSETIRDQLAWQRAAGRL